MGYTTYELLWLFFNVFGARLGAWRGHGEPEAENIYQCGCHEPPLCPVYGVGAVVNAIFLKELKGTPVFLFIGGMLLLHF